MSYVLELIIHKDTGLAPFGQIILVKNMLKFQGVKC
jgi:hypothetical protein